MVLFIVDFRTGARGAGLQNMKEAQVLRLSRRTRDFFLKLEFTKTLRDGAMHVCPIEPDHVLPKTCSVTPMTRYAAAVALCQWDLTRGRLFPLIGRTGTLANVDYSTPMNPLSMTARLRAAARRARTGDKKKHVFLPGWGTCDKNNIGIRHFLHYIQS